MHFPSTEGCPLISGDAAGKSVALSLSGHALEKAESRTCALLLLGGWPQGEAREGSVLPPLGGQTHEGGEPTLPVEHLCRHCAELIISNRSRLLNCQSETAILLSLLLHASVSASTDYNDRVDGAEVKFEWSM